MAFNKDLWFCHVWEDHADDRKPSACLLEHIGDALAALHAEIDALKARLPEPEPARETGWAVRSRGGGLYTRTSWFSDSASAIDVLWFPDKKAADVLVDALSYGEPVLLYKDTLEEVLDAV